MHPKTASKVHESPFVMLLPLVILAGLSLTVGFIDFWPTVLSNPITHELHLLHEKINASHLHSYFLLFTNMPWIAGLFLSFLFYKAGANEDNLEVKAPSIYNLLSSKLWFDEIYNAFVHKIQQPFAQFLNFVDHVILAGLVFRGFAGIFGFSSLVFRKLHTGSVQSYLCWFLLGVLIYSVYLMINLN